MTTATATTPSSLQAAADAAAAANLQAASASSNGTTSSSALTNPLVSLGQNFNDFLSLLTTQLQNQDPTSPMDTNQFTQELVSFTGVQQSVATNSNLTTLISMTQGSEVLQSAQVIGHDATVTSPEIALQGGTGTITFTAPNAEQVQVAIVNSAGQPVLDGTINAQAGTNTWVWSGQSTSGTQMPDGAYGIALETGSATAPVPQSFSVIGTATGMTNGASGVQLDMGSMVVPLGSVLSLSQ